MSTQYHGNAAAAAGQSTYQERLISYCRDQGARTPNFQIVSDRRGGRTAWSCVVLVQGTSVAARFWYDGQYVNNAREDAAEKALQMLGVLPTPPTQQPAAAAAHYRSQPQQGSQFGGAISNN